MKGEDDSIERVGNSFIFLKTNPSAAKLDTKISI